jgi:MFS family permease
MLALAVGWELYERTNSALALGVVGLIQLLPMLLLAPKTGQLADRHSRKAIVVLAQLVVITSSLGLAALSFWQGPLAGVYGCLLLRGIGSAFQRPALAAMPAMVLPEEAFENSASWSNTSGEIPAIAGPALGGLAIALLHTTALVYLFSAVMGLAFLVMLVFVNGSHGAQRRASPKEEQATLHSFLEGVRFLRQTPVVASALTLDLFAVLLGGATTLLPVFARDILQVGPSGLGWLQASTSLGALLVTVYLAHQPPIQRAGPVLLLAVAGFGVATIAFGISRSFWLSLAALATLGGLDGVSMVVRDTLLLTRVPDGMRGRVAAIEGVFVNSSNQLGGFESGLTAQLFGPVLSVVGGGFGTILVVAAIAFIWPELRLLRAMREAQTEP